ncbi:hypothetical protein HA466_0042860 [Hirschfeldia incana]|nr:hypothetical protein HA466_0042860 [Hirschfeldia incana]
MAKNPINSIFLSALLIVLLVSNGLPKAKGRLCYAEEGAENVCVVPGVDIQCACVNSCKAINPTYIGKCVLLEGIGFPCECYKPCP